MADIFHSPAPTVKAPAKKGSQGVYDGEPGYQKRTPSSRSLPEKVRDEPAGLPKKD